LKEFFETVDPSSSGKQFCFGWLILVSFTLTLICTGGMQLAFHLCFWNVNDSLMLFPSEKHTIFQSRFCNNHKKT
jgi:hypothetical protein